VISFDLYTYKIYYLKTKVFDSLQKEI